MLKEDTALCHQTPQFFDSINWAQIVLEVSQQVVVIQSFLFLSSFSFFCLPSSLKVSQVGTIILFLFGTSSKIVLRSPNQHWKKFSWIQRVQTLEEVNKKNTLGSIGFLLESKGNSFKLRLGSWFKQNSGIFCGQRDCLQPAVLCVCNTDTPKARIVVYHAPSIIFPGLNTWHQWYLMSVTFYLVSDIANFWMD